MPVKKAATKSASAARKPATKTATKSTSARRTTSASKSVAKPTAARKTVTTSAAKAAAKPVARKTATKVAARRTVSATAVPAQDTAPKVESMPVVPAAHVPAAPAKPIQVAPLPPAPTGRAGMYQRPIEVWLLTLVTLGIYGIVIHYRLNKEMKEFCGVKVTPTYAALSFFVPVAGIISVINTAARVRQCQAAVGLKPDCSSGMSFVAMFVAAHGAYQQSKINQVWQHVASSRQQQAQPASA